MKGGYTYKKIRALRTISTKFVNKRVSKQRTRNTHRHGKSYRKKSKHRKRTRKRRRTSRK